MRYSSATKPLVPEDRIDARPRAYLYRAAAVAVLAHARRQNPDVVLREHFASDKITPLVLRAETNPAALYDSDWAGSVAASAVADAVVGLAPKSAGAQLISRGLKVSLAGRASIKVPRRLVVANDAGGFVLEGEPIPVQQHGVTAGPTLAPRKFGVITAFTREVTEHAVVNFESIARQIVSEAAALALDAALFSDEAASGLRPAGLLNGQAAISATSGGGTDAISEDLKALIGALADAGAGRDVVFVVSPVQAATLKFWAGPAFDYPLLTSSALDEGHVIAIDAASFVSAFSGEPEFKTSDQTVLHYEDTDPQPITDASEDAAPVGSLFQTDATALRMILRCAWGMRAAGHVQHITDVSW